MAEKIFFFLFAIMTISLMVFQAHGYISDFVRWKIQKPLKLDFIDVSRAYFHAPSKRTVYVKLPPEESSPGKVGKLRKSMYGTRDAAQNWEAAYTEVLLSHGFTQSAASPCVFYNKTKDLRLVIHGGDFTSLGEEESLMWFRKVMEKHFTVKFRGMIGPESTDQKSIRILNRVIEWSSEGIRYEADPRHAEISMEDVEVNSESKPLSTPGLMDK